MSFGVRDLKQQRKGNVLRMASLHGVLQVLAATSLSVVLVARMQAQSRSGSLPDAPSALLFAASDSEAASAPTIEWQSADRTEAQTAKPAPTQIATPAASLPPCPKKAKKGRVPIIFMPLTQPSCADPLQFIVDTGHVPPLSVKQKGILATRDVTDPFNLMTIGFFSAVSIAADAHTVYGPGFAGWGRESGYSLGEDIQSEFTGTFVIPSLTHEDPRYHRMPGASVSRRIKHALIHTLVSQHDDGSLMPNYATLINYPLSAEISNLYVPNVGTNVVSTTRRILAGYATDPIGPLLAEFLPDFAKRVHIHVIFAQQILNHMAPGSGEGSSSF